jgi:hypothetical protein
MTILIFNSAAAVGPTVPTAATRAPVYVDDDPASILADVADTVGHYREIVPPVVPSHAGKLRHVATGRPLVKA